MQQNNNKAAFEVFDASTYKVGIVAAQFNRDMCEAMVQESIAKCVTYSVADDNIDVFRVAGSVEIPVVLKKLAASGKYNCLVAIGVIIKGETPHFDYVAKIVTEGVLRVQLDHTIPIGFGVLTVENDAQARARVHVGAEATAAAMHSAQILSTI